jgi:hypothetical protein
MEFLIEMLVNRKVKDNWSSEAELKYTRLRYKLKIKRFTNERGFEDLVVVDENLTNLKHNEDQWVQQHIPKELFGYWRPKVGASQLVMSIKTHRIG